MTRSIRLTPATALLAGLTLAGLAACGDAVSPTAPHTAAPSFAKGNSSGSVTVCHAAGQAGTTHYVALTISVNALSAHIDEHGTPRAGHESDYIAGSDGLCTGAQVSKTLVGVYRWDGSKMALDASYMPGKVTIPQGETRWLEYRIDYSVPGTGSATLTDNLDAACATLAPAGPGFECTSSGIDGYPAHTQSVTVSGSGHLMITIDLHNVNACGDRDFVNTAVLAPAVGAAVSASSTVMAWTPACTR